MNTQVRHGLAAACALVLAACGGGGGGGGSSPAQAPTTGSLSVALTDGPIESASQVVIKFSAIELHRANGENVTINFSPAKSIDLLTLQNGVKTDLLKDQNVPAGAYQWIRLTLVEGQNVQDGSFIKINDAQFPLFIPGGMESGLKMVREFTVGQGGATSLLIDFDLRKSIHATGGPSPNMMMRPVLRLMDQLQVGKVSGTVNLTTLASAQGTTVANCKPGLYVFSGSNTKPDDDDGDAANGADPVLYMPLKPEGTATTVAYAVPFLEVGNYTVAATCNYDVEKGPGSDDYDPNATAPVAPATNPKYQSMKWSTANTAVTANQTTTLNLPLP